MRALRRDYKVTQIMKDHVYKKQYDLRHARNYTYKHGEVERIARARFERALKTDDLHQIPNVTFFYKQYVLDRDLASKETKEKKEELKILEEQIQQFSQGLPINQEVFQSRNDAMKKDKFRKTEKPRQMTILDLQKLAKNAKKLIEKREKDQTSLDSDIKKIERFLKENTRQSGYVVDETQRPVSIENIEAQE